MLRIEKKKNIQAYTQTQNNQVFHKYKHKWLFDAHIPASDVHRCQLDSIT